MWMNRDIRKICLPGGESSHRRDFSRLHSGDSFHELFAQTVHNLSLQSDSYNPGGGGGSSTNKTTGSEISPRRQHPILVSFSADAAPCNAEANCHPKCPVCTDSAGEGEHGFSLNELHQMAFIAGADKNVRFCKK